MVKPGAPAAPSDGRRRAGLAGFGGGVLVVCGRRTSRSVPGRPWGLDHTVAVLLVTTYPE